MTEYLSLNTGPGMQLSEFENYLSFEIRINRIEINTGFSKGLVLGCAAGDILHCMLKSS